MKGEIVVGQIVKGLIVEGRECIGEIDIVCGV